MESMLVGGLPVVGGVNAREVAERVSDHLAGGTPIAVTFINLHSFGVAARSERYRRDIREFDYVFPDGIAMAHIATWVSGIKCSRVSFDATSLYAPVFEALAVSGASVLVVGGTEREARTCAQGIWEEFPGLNRCVGCPGYLALEKILDRIGREKVDMVLIGCGVGVQEEIGAEVKRRSLARAVFTCGGFVSQYSERGREYYPGWTDRLALRWVVRLWRSPSRMGRRYLLEYPAGLGRLIEVEARQRFVRNR